MPSRPRFLRCRRRSRISLLAEDDERLFAGAEDGAIYMWRLDRGHQRFDEVAALAGHDGHAVASLAQGKGALYSGAADGGIRVWDLETRRCVCSFAGHASRVTALLCWDRFLLSFFRDLAELKPGVTWSFHSFFTWSENSPSDLYFGTEGVHI